VTTLLHISDLHFGRPYRPDLGNAVLELEKSLSPQLTICSGDIVQWCESKTSWNQAEAFFSQFTAPYLAIPGNHDIPRAFFWKRFTRIYESFHQALGCKEDSVFTADGLCVVGLSSAAAWSADLGFINAKQLDWMASVFEQCPEGTLKVVVQHQAPKPLRRGWLRTHCWGASRALDRYLNAHVHLILSGHNHFPHIEQVTNDKGQGLLWAQCGTTTSRRIRRAGSSFNACNVLRFSSSAIEISVFRYDALTERFTQDSAREFTR